MSSMRNIKIHYQTLTCGRWDVHVGVSTAMCWKLWSSRSAGLSDWKREREERLSCCNIPLLFPSSQSHSHTHYNPNACFDIWQQLQISKMSKDSGRPLFILSAWTREPASREVVEFLIWQYGNSTELNHKTTMTLLSSWSYTIVKYHRTKTLSSDPPLTKILHELNSLFDVSWEKRLIRRVVKYIIQFSQNALHDTLAC